MNEEFSPRAVATIALWKSAPMQTGQSAWAYLGVPETQSVHIRKFTYFIGLQTLLFPEVLPVHASLEKMADNN